MVHLQPRCQRQPALHSTNTLAGAALNIFNNSVQKDNMWAASSNAQAPSMFVSNTASNSLQKPPHVHVRLANTVQTLLAARRHSGLQQHHHKIYSV